MSQRHYSTCARPRAALRASCLCDISSASPLTSTSTVRELTLALVGGLTATAAGNSRAAAASKYFGGCPRLRARASPAAKVFLERTGAVLVLRIWGSRLGMSLFVI